MARTTQQVDRTRYRGALAGLAGVLVVLAAFGVTEAASMHRHAAALDPAGLRGAERSVLNATPVLFALGLLLLGFLGMLLARITRQLGSQARKSAHSALHDALTGLGNRTWFADRLERALLAAGPNATPFSVVMIDLDRFKEINDTLGHSIGDRVLREIGPRLLELLGPGDSLARLGDDEFALLLCGVDSEQAMQTTQRMLAVLREPFVLGQLRVTVDASVGIVTYPTHGGDVETLVQRAGIVMDLAKGRGGGAAVYDPADDPYDPERLVLVADLRDAIDNGELELHYQPQFAARDLRLVGVEALVRWNHPTRGQLPPGDFIALAEHSGLIRPLTLTVLRGAARQWREWHADGIEISVSVNLSLANLLDEQLVDDVARILCEERMPADRLVLEITESTVMTDPQRSIAVLERLAGTGIGLSIDDYGTGHSSLANLRRLPVHELKIDQAFVQRLAVDGEDAQIVRSTIALAHSLGLRVVAEGVEDPLALAVLRYEACDLVQGYHLGRPARAAGLAEPLRRMPSPEVVTA